MDLPTLEVFIKTLDAKFAAQAEALRATRQSAPPPSAPPPLR
jgi:hypothetical protein